MSLALWEPLGGDPARAFGRADFLAVAEMSRRSSRRSAGGAGLEKDSDADWESEMRARRHVRVPEGVALPAGTQLFVCRRDARPGVKLLGQGGEGGKELQCIGLCDADDIPLTLLLWHCIVDLLIGVIVKLKGAPRLIQALAFGLLAPHPRRIPW